MPTRADIQAARPRCAHMPEIRTMAGLSTPPVKQCLAPLNYLRTENAWHCPACNRMHEGERLASRLTPC